MNQETVEEKWQRKYLGLETKCTIYKYILIIILSCLLVQEIKQTTFCFYQLNSQHK